MRILIYTLLLGCVCYAQPTLRTGSVQVKQNPKDTLYQWHNLAVENTGGIMIDLKPIFAKAETTSKGMIDLARDTLSLQ